MRRSVTFVAVLALALATSLATFAAPVASAANAEEQPIGVTGARGALSVGGYGTCVLKPDGTIQCFGDTKYGQAISPVGTYRYVDRGGYFGSCALDVYGKISCWGQYATPYPTSGEFTQVSLGFFVGCALNAAGKVTCWGDTQYAAFPDGTYTMVSAGYDQACAIQSTGTLRCWGYNNSGEASPPAGSFIDVATANARTCGITASGAVVCWGYSGWTITPPTSGVYTHISGSNNHFCALRVDGAAVCWGDNTYGEATAPSGTFVTVVAGGYRSCGVRPTGQLECWGMNGSGQNAVPSGLTARVTDIVVSAGDGHACRIGVDSKAYCWGDNSSGQLNVPGILFRSISAGKGFTCGITTAGYLRCWGDNAHGQLNAPSEQVRAVSAGDGYACAIALDGIVKCWGSFNHTASWRYDSISVANGGFCGVREDGWHGCTSANGTGYAANTPMVMRVGAGNGFYCAITSVSSLYCEGTSNPLPAQPSGTFVELAVGPNHLCAISTDGSVACFGDNTYGQGTANIGMYLGLSAGPDYTCGIKSNQTVDCWGTGGPAHQPVAPGAPTNVTGTPATASVAVSWTEPASGGTPIKWYLVTASPGGRTCSATTGTSCTVTGLSNGTAYTFSVTATNAVGTGAAGSSDPITPIGPPSAPRSVAAAGRNASVVVSWQPPSTDGGRPITWYTAIATPGGAKCSTSTLSCTIPGLMNGVTYSISVTAKNDQGSSPAANVTGVVPRAAITRYYGPDRFATAAEIADQTFGADCGCYVYVANAWNFPDALAGAAAASKARGPVLLADATGTLNAETAAAIAMLKPIKIVVLGGESAIGSGVYDQLKPLATSIVRYSGANRFETAANVAMGIFGADCGCTAYIANAWNFPDALAGAAAAGKGHGPVLLANATSPLDPSTAAALAALKPAQIVVLGGTGAIGADVYATLGTLSPHVARYSGNDRFSTAAQIANSAFGPSCGCVVYIANAWNFPDALAGAAAAGKIHGPILLVNATGAVDGDTAAAIANLKPNAIVVLGGEGAVSKDVFDALGALAP